MKPYTTPVSPELFESGNIGASTGVSDVYFDTSPEEDVTKIVVATLVEKLPEWQRSAVEMTIMYKMTYEDAAEHISLMRGKKTDKKTVWKWSRKGLRQLEEWLTQPWVHNITGGKVPDGS